MARKPPKMRTVHVGVAPKAGNPNIDPAPMHNCQLCGQMKPDCVRQVYPPEPARWTCHPC